MRSAIAIAVVVVVVAASGCGNDGISREIGARCDRTTDCADRCLPPSAAYPDGMCTVDCTDASDCPDAAECIEREGGVCLFACRDEADCDFLGPSWTCVEQERRGGTERIGVCLGA